MLSNVSVALDVRSVRDHLEVARRVSDIPLTATVRGVWFSMAADYVQRLGPSEAATLRAALPRRRRVPFLNYSLREYVEELAMSAAIVNAKDPWEGMRTIWRSATSAYVATPLGRSLVNLIRPEPLRYMRWLVEHRDHFCNYGNWRLVQHGDGYVTMEMENEYIWLESAHLGGAEGVLIACGLPGTVEAERFDDYNGRLHIRWQPRRYAS